MTLTSLRPCGMILKTQHSGRLYGSCLTTSYSASKQILGYTVRYVEERVRLDQKLTEPSVH